MGIAVALGVVLFYSNSRTPIYQATATIFVQGGRTTLGAPDASDIATSVALARTYRDLILTRPILDKVGEQLGLPSGPGGVSITSAGSFIQVQARDRDPEMASLVANTTARTFIDDFRIRQFTQIAQFEVSLEQFGITPDSSIIAARAATMSTLSIIEEALPPGSPLPFNTRLQLFFGVVLGLIAAGVWYFCSNISTIGSNRLMS